jgi:uncharacterized membrane protein
MLNGFDHLIYGLILFLVFHLGLGAHEVKSKLVEYFGLKVFRILHGLGSTFSLYLSVIGFADRPFVDVYSPPNWGHWVPVIVMPFALILLVGFKFHQIQRISRHAMLVGIFLFALAHLFANGDLGSVLLFGTFLGYVPLAMLSGDKKQRLSDVQGWKLFKSRTSIIPFMAIREGRAMKNTGGTGRLAVFIGLLLYFGLVFAHPYFTGLSIPVFSF